MNKHESVKKSTHPYADDSKRSKNVFIKIGIFVFFAVGLLIGSLHYFGIIQYHRIPRILTAPFRPPERADTAQPIKYERAGFRFLYPANWQIDTANKHFDPEMFLILDAPRHGQFRLQIIPSEIDPRDMVEQVTERFSIPGLSVIDRIEFTFWGKYRGYGLTLLGEKMGDLFKIRIFSHGGTTKSIVVWEYWWDGPESINASGFQLIEKSFRF